MHLWWLPLCEQAGFGHPLIGGFGVFTGAVMGAWPGSGWDGAFPDLMPVGSLSSVPPARDATLPVIEWESPEGRGDNMAPGCQNTLVPSPINSSSCGSAACCGIIPGYSRLFPGNAAP